MAPPCPSIHASELPVKIQQDGQGKKRKLEAGKKNIDLSACQLFEMLQYKCEVQRPLTKESPVRCFAVDRTFRRCKDKKSEFMVETTEWDRGVNGETSAASSTSHPSKPHHWSYDQYDPTP